MPAMEFESRSQRFIIISQNVADDTTRPMKRPKVERSSSAHYPPLMQLPCETRCEIYHLLFRSVLKAPAKPVLHLDFANRGKHAQKAALPNQGENLIWIWKTYVENSILHVCRQIRLEALDVLYKDTVFVWPTMSYKPETIRTVLSPLKPRLYHSIRHIQLTFAMKPDVLTWDDETTMYNACYTEWEQSLPGLKNVDVLVQVLPSQRDVIQTEDQICKAAAFLVKVMLPFRNVERVLLVHPGRLRPGYRGHGTLMSGGDPELRVLHLATETIRIKRLMSLRRQLRESAQALTGVTKEDNDSVATVLNKLVQ